MTTEEYNKVRHKSGWSDRILQYIDSEEEAQIYIRAGLKEAIVGGRPALILGALGYFILPLDLIADVIPVFGFTDDIAPLTLAYKALQVSVTPEIDAKAQAKVDELFS